MCQFFRDGHILVALALFTGDLFNIAMCILECILFTFGIKAVRFSIKAK